MRTASPPAPIVVSKYPLHWQEPGSREKWLILGLKQEMDKMSPEHPVVPESRKLSKTNCYLKGCLPAKAEYLSKQKHDKWVKL